MEVKLNGLNCEKSDMPVIRVSDITGSHYLLEPNGSHYPIGRPMQCALSNKTPDLIKSIDRFLEELSCATPQRESSPLQFLDFGIEEYMKEVDLSIADMRSEGAQPHTCNIDCVKDIDEDRFYFHELCLDEVSEIREFKYWHMIPKTIYNYNILVIGEDGIGKTSLVKRFAFKEVARHYSRGDNLDIIKKIYRLDMLTKLNLRFIKISGVKPGKLAAHKNYVKPHGALFMYDLTNPSTFKNIPKWKKELDSKVVLSDGSPIPCILIGTKCDMMKSEAPNPSKMEEFCSRYKFSSWYETSAIEVINIRLCFLSLITKIYQHDAMHKRVPIEVKSAKKEEMCSIL